MNKMILGAAGAAFLLALGSATSALGQMGYTPTPPPPQVPTPQGHSGSSTPSHGNSPHVRPALAKILSEAVKLNDAQDYAGALAKIREADAAASDKTPEEEFTIGKFMGSVALHMNDHAGALAGFNRAVASNAIPDAEKPNILYIDMVLNAEQKNFAQAVAIGEQLAALGPLDEKASVALSQSYYNKGDYPNALKIASAALAKGVTDPTNKAALLEVQTKAQAQSGNTAGAVASLEQQCAEKCDAQSWGSLVAVTMGKISGLTDHMALNLFRLKLMAGVMTADDYITMATLDVSSGLPAEAKSVLEKGIAAGTITRGGRAAELLNRATPAAAADARTLPQFEREASAKASGEEDIKLGESYYSHGQLDQAVTALRRGLGKSGVRDAADANITLGIVLIAKGDKAGAAAAFAAASSGRQAPVAHLWSVYANRKG